MKRDWKKIRIGGTDNFKRHCINVRKKGDKSKADLEIIRKFYPEAISAKIRQVYNGKWQTIETDKGLQPVFVTRIIQEFSQGWTEVVCLGQGHRSRHENHAPATRFQLLIELPTRDAYADFSAEELNPKKAV